VAVCGDYDVLLVTFKVCLPVFGGVLCGSDSDVHALKRAAPLIWGLGGLEFSSEVPTAQHAAARSTAESINS
jgi:hypothetical protein